MLAVEKGENWREALTAENVRVAVNQELVKGNPRVKPGDEIAFFPPVTGG
ncbi:MAG: MoaD/ThiS family protein [Pseudomonadales bacterium]